MLCLAGKREELPTHLMEDMGRYRHKVFVDHLGWPLQSPGDVESDEFDGPGAVYVSSLDSSGQVNGVARLLPTTAPYLLEKVFPRLWVGPALPNSAEVWELSRFAAMDFNSCQSLTHQATASHAARLLRRAMQIAKEQGARELVTVSPIGVERLLRANGFHCKRAGPPARHYKDFIVALIINLDDVGWEERLE